MVKTNLHAVVAGNVVDVVVGDDILGQCAGQTSPKVESRVNPLPVFIGVFADLLELEDVEGRSVDHFLGSLVDLEHRDHVLDLDLVRVLLDFGVVALRAVVLFAVEEVGLGVARVFLRYDFRESD